MSARLTDLPDREFQIWRHSVSMGRLLLRSTKTDAHPTRIDVLFQDVRAVSLATSLSGVVMTENEGHPDVMKGLGACASGDPICYQIRSGSKVGYVVASVFAQNEDEGEFFDPSALWTDAFEI